MNPALMLTHNALELTKKAIDSVLAQDIPVRLMILDNASTDATVEYTRSLSLQTAVFNPSIGVSRGWNYGLRYFFEMGEEHVLVVNNDVELPYSFYRSLLEEGGGFVTGVGVDDHGQVDADALSSNPNANNTKRPHPHFSAFLVRKWVWDKVGPFDESMELYVSDADYHLRMHQLGIPAYTNGMPFYHVGSATIKRNPEEARAIQMQADKDRETFFKKWGVRVASPEYYNLFK